MLTGNGAACYTSEERMYVSAMIMIGGFVQAVIVGNVALLASHPAPIPGLLCLSLVLTPL